MKKIASGKVREIFDVGEGHLLIVTTDRISAFDVILPCLIKGKGVVLNTISKFWFDHTKDIVANHMVSARSSDFPEEFQNEEYKGRSMLVKKLKMIPYEVIVRGYLFGSMFDAYKKEGAFLGHKLPALMKLAQKLPAPIVTPSTKASEGHDVNVTLEQMKGDLGESLATDIERAALAVYKKCYEHAFSRGVIIADTKFEFGLDENGKLVLADEVLTPDSSRFWAKSEYKEGVSPASFDKQFIRDYLKANNLAGRADIKASDIDGEVIKKTEALYKKCQELICE